MQLIYTLLKPFFTQRYNQAVFSNSLLRSLRMSGYRKGRGIVYMLISALFFAFMGVTVKAAVNIPLAQKVLFRNLVMVVLISFTLFGKGKKAFFGNRENRGLLFARSLLGMAGVFLYFYSLSSLHLADASMLNKLSPFFVTLFSVLFLKEKLKRYQIPALLAAFLGTLLVIKPQWNLEMLPALAGFCAAIVAGGAYTLINALKGREHPNTVIFWFSGVSTLGLLPFSLSSWVNPNLFELASLLGTGVFAAGGQYFLTRAYQLAPAAEISIYNYSHILFSILMGLIFFAELPDALSCLGAVIIIGVALFLYLAGKRTRAVQA